MKKSEKILILFIIAIMSLCFVGCQQSEQIYTDNSSMPTGNTKVPIVIVDDRDDNSSSNSSDIEEIIDSWENIVPDIEIEVDDSSKDNSSSSGNISDSTVTDESGNDNNSSNITSSEKEEFDNSSENQSSDNTSSEDDEVVGPNRPDDGYFDVAV